MSKLNRIARKGALLFIGAALLTTTANEASAQTIRVKKFPIDAPITRAGGVSGMAMCPIIGTYDFDTTIVSEEPVLQSFVLWALPGASNPRSAVNVATNSSRNFATTYLSTYYDHVVKLRSDHQAFELRLAVQPDNTVFAENTISPIRIDLSQPETNVVIWLGGSSYNTAKVKVRTKRVDCQ
jgi:hypothetical protein